MTGFMEMKKELALEFLTKPFTVVQRFELARVLCGSNEKGTEEIEYLLSGLEDRYKRGLYELNQLAFASQDLNMVIEIPTDDPRCNREVTLLEVKRDLSEFSQELGGIVSREILGWRMPEQRSERIINNAVQ